MSYVLKKRTLSGYKFRSRARDCVREESTENGSEVGATSKARHATTKIDFGKLTLAGLLILVSIVAPFSRVFELTPEKFGDFLIKGGIYLVCMMLAVSFGYAFILFEYCSKVNKINAARTAIEFSRHIYPMALLVCISNIVLGLSSYLGNTGQLIFNEPLCKAAQMCTGTSIVLIFPNVAVPNGMLLYAFWGAFIFNCYQYLRRIVNNDFLPSIWLSGAVRLAAAILASMIVFVILFQDTYDWKSYAAGTGLTTTSERLTPGYAVAVAFFSGFFPMTTIRMTFRLIFDRVSQLTSLLGKYVHTPLTVIDGITVDVQDRLAEAGVDSLQMLSRSTVEALTNPDGKALPYERAVLEDWIDQAKLSLYFSEEEELAEMRSIGIRTYSDLQEYKRMAQSTPIDFDTIGLKAIPSSRLKAFIQHGTFP